MKSLRSRFKYLFQITNSLSLLDRLSFWRAKRKYQKANREFKKTDPNFLLPSDYYLYETYKLDYRHYQQDGLGSAKDVINWTARYLPENKTILEWGCGVSRVVRHLPTLVANGSKIYACDINEGMIAWNKANISDVSFELIPYDPPTPYANAFFDLVYALSVFTHIESKDQMPWVSEIARIIKPGGIFLFTTHGAGFSDKLSKSQLEELNRDGSYSISYHQKGHRMMTTYNCASHFRKMIEKHFEVLEHDDGASNNSRTGGQDLWIVRRK